MAKRKPGGKPLQAQQGSKANSSQQDKRNRLARRNGERRRTTHANVPLVHRGDRHRDGQAARCANLISISHPRRQCYAR